MNTPSILALAITLIPIHQERINQKTRDSWRDYVVTCLDTLVEHGTDVYGDVETPLLMAVLDVRTRRSPESPEPFDSMVRLEERMHRRAERGSNPWYDQKTLRCMLDSGDAKLERAANAYVAHFFDHCHKQNGMPAWGSHVHWDCYEEAPGGDQDGEGPHEILVYEAEWSAMYAIRPRLVRAAVDGIWKWHVVDKETGQHNRHDDARAGCDFAFSGGPMAVAFASMYAATGEESYLEKARIVADWHWRHRHPETGLVPDAPTTGGRYDSTHMFTNEAGLFAANLLRCFELTGDEHFRAMAVHYVKTFDRYAWDDEAGTYFAMLQLDGTPVQARSKGTGYDRWEPSGHVEVWRTSIFSYEFTLSAAQASVYAYEQSAVGAEEGDPELLAIARRWASVVESALPPSPDRRWKKELTEALPAVSETGGVYAEDYGRAISFFVHMARATGEVRFHWLANGLAREAVEKLYENGLFKGHPAKPYYEAVDGVGLLLHALLELDDPDRSMPGAF